jgi:hypothetical protein
MSGQTLFLTPDVIELPVIAPPDEPALALCRCAMSLFAIGTASPSDRNGLGCVSRLVTRFASCTRRSSRAMTVTVFAAAIPRTWNVRTCWPGVSQPLSCASCVSQTASLHGLHLDEQRVVALARLQPT